MGFQEGTSNQKHAFSQSTTPSHAPYPNKPTRICTAPFGQVEIQGALKGTNLRGQTEPKRRFSLILLILAVSWKTKHLGIGDFRRKPQKTAGTRSKPQIGVCPLRLRFVPLSAALEMTDQTQPNVHQISTRVMTGHTGRNTPKICTL